MRKRPTYFLSALLVLALCLTSFFVPTAYAYSDPKADATVDPKPTSTGEPLSKESGLVTRDLLYDQATNKQFITVQDKDGNLFYVIIDYDAPMNEDEEQFQTYFLSPVSVSELSGLADNGQEKPISCDCTDKCVAGAIKMDCPLCASNMSECAGIAPAPVEEPVPSEQPEPGPEPTPGATSGVNPAVLLVLVLALGGGGAVAYFKFLQPKQQSKPTNDPDDDLEDEDWDDGEEDSEA